ncbi:GNAT family N-acetyltransferase [Anaerosporobacter sp.]|uniref:GNAT family N-acetyltransferase n=1 Tax=Anaerosporobacter sp. TaxID=1872529 RepID=UPI00286F1D33|nr:GNAT family N-acetyltransferase [Anaerosporobacter sp.]
MIFKLDDTKKAEKIFGDWQETSIWSCLQNVMGEIYVDDLNEPQSAMAILADFCFFAGKPNDELVMYKPESCSNDFIIMVPRDDEWAKRIASNYGEKAKEVTRYAIKKEANVFDKDKLEEIVHSLQSGYALKLIDEDIYNWCMQNNWSRDFVAQYKEYAMYQKFGLGVVAVEEKTKEPVSGASSYTSYREGIEIEIDTKEEYRRQGLAYACGAKLILECMKRNLYPSWDAQNKWSVALAEKLGYHYDHEYAAYEIYGY